VLSDRYLQRAREAGALSELPLALMTRLYALLFAGALTAAAALAEEMRAALAATGTELPCVFRTGKLRLIHAASCPFRYSSKTSCGVRYPSVEWRRVLL